MDIKNEIESFKSMVNSYKLSSLIITSNNIGIFKSLNKNPKSIEILEEELKIT